MRSKVLAVLGLTAVLLTGCTQAEPAPADTALSDSDMPATPANEMVLGSLTGTATSSTLSSEFSGTSTSAVAVYLSCSSEGEVKINVANSAPLTVPCGTKENPTRQVFDVPSSQQTFPVDLQGDGVVMGLVVTEAKR